MEVKVKKLIDWNVALDAARYTVHKNAIGKMPSEEFSRSIVDSEHSPLRCVTFMVEMIGIPSFVSTHFARHKFGAEHFVSTNRPDRNGGNTKIDRMTPVNHMMLVNAQELLFMARRRLCGKASPETRAVMQAIKCEINKIDPYVGEAMLPMCYYRGGCHEQNGCGLYKGISTGEQNDLRKEKKMKLKFKRLDKLTQIPSYSHSDDSGMDIRSNETVVLLPRTCKKIHTGIAAVIPSGYELQVRPRSGMCSRGIVAAWGTVDEGYRGEICVTLYNHTDANQFISTGDRIAQLVLAPVVHAEIEETESLGVDTERGENGFGSTGA